MKVKGKIDLFINQNETRIIIHCATSDATICEVTLTPEQLSSAMSRLSLTPCELEFYEQNSHKIGKEHKWDKLEFEVNDELEKNGKKNALHQLALKLCPEGWEPDNHYGSQGSFFTKDGKRYARTTIRTWI